MSIELSSSLLSHLRARHVPLYPLDKENHPQFWPDPELMLSEALHKREQDGENRLELTDRQKWWMQPENAEKLQWAKDNGYATEAMVRVIHADSDTPHLNQLLEQFTDTYGNFGETKASYFFIDPDDSDNYGWHVDTDIKSPTIPRGIMCAMNVVLTDINIPVEFQNQGEFTYRAAMFNTDWLHRVHTNKKLRVLARIAFTDSIYEEIVHKIKRIHKKANK